MSSKTIMFQGYAIEIFRNPEDYTFEVKNPEGKVIAQSPQPYQIEDDAEVNAKMIVNSIVMKQKGFTII